MLAWLLRYSWLEMRHHPWRHAAAVVTVMLGVALSFSVHLINASAFSEFSSAVRAVNGEPDLELRAVRGGFDEALYANVAAHPMVALASPVLEVQTQLLTGATRRQPLRVLGLDALAVATIAPSLLPQPARATDRMTLFAPRTVFLNDAAQRLLEPAAGVAAADDTPAQIEVQVGLALASLRVAGRVAAGGPALAVMDIAAAQDLFARAGQLSRIDIRLAPGVSAEQFLAALPLPDDVTPAVAADNAQRVGQLSRAYRVNLTVLALVALFTGAFLVFSILSLSVARRAQQFALLGIVGMTARERLRLVLAESAALGLLGSALGLALGTALAATALRLLQGDLGGGYFGNITPALHWSHAAALGYGVLGVLAAMVGGWWPAQSAAQLPLAPTLKGLGSLRGPARQAWLAPAALALGLLLALAPPVFGLPIAAYLAVALLLLGGIALLPWAVHALHDRLAPLLQGWLLALLAVERARRVREAASVAVSGVVAALSLAVALTVMVASFRDSVLRWLDVVLPAQLYVRTAASANASGAPEAALLTPAFAQAIARVDGVERVGTLRTVPLLLDASRPPVVLIARALGDPQWSLPLVGSALPAPPGRIAIHVSEAMVDLYGARVGEDFEPLARAWSTRGAPGRFFVAGVWRDYARQSGSVVIDTRDYQALSGDPAINDIALWLTPGTSEAAVQQAIRELAQREGLQGPQDLLEFASSGDIRAMSIRIFDRSFAVTYWLQAVAIAIGLFGVAASFSAQVLARRKEFGLLTHLGLTRRQILTLVALEGAAWTVVGALAGLVLGIAVSAILVHVINPQSFHWTMDMVLPVGRLAWLSLAVVAAGTLTAWLAGRAAARHDAVLAVKEDW